jgi:hypothetical protein
VTSRRMAVVAKLMNRPCPRNTSVKGLSGDPDFDLSNDHSTKATQSARWKRDERAGMPTLNHSPVLGEAPSEPFFEFGSSATSPSRNHTRLLRAARFSFANVCGRWLACLSVRGMAGRTGSRPSFVGFGTLSGAMRKGALLRSRSRGRGPSDPLQP